MQSIWHITYKKWPSFKNNKSATLKAKCHTLNSRQVAICPRRLWAFMSQRLVRQVGPLCEGWEQHGEAEPIFWGWGGKTRRILTKEFSTKYHFQFFLRKDQNLNFNSYFSPLENFQYSLSMPEVKDAGWEKRNPSWNYILRRGARQLI